MKKTTPRNNYEYQTRNTYYKQNVPPLHTQQSYQSTNVQQQQPQINRSTPPRSPHAGRVVVTQITSDVWQYENDWAYDLCSCGEDCQDCFLAFCCAPCYTCELFDKTNEYLCTPCFVPMALMALRSKLRTGFRIKGSICKDCLVVACCPCCTAIQMKNELARQGL